VRGSIGPGSRERGRRLKESAAIEYLKTVRLCSPNSKGRMAAEAIRGGRPGQLRRRLPENVTQSEVGKNRHLIDFINGVQRCFAVFLIPWEPHVRKEVGPVKDVVDSGVNFQM